MQVTHLAQAWRVVNTWYVAAVTELNQLALCPEPLALKLSSVNQEKNIFQGSVFNDGSFFKMKTGITEPLRQHLSVPREPRSSSRVNKIVPSHGNAKAFRLLLLL